MRNKPVLFISLRSKSNIIYQRVPQYQLTSSVPSETEQYQASTSKYHIHRHITLTDGYLYKINI